MQPSNCLNCEVKLSGIDKYCSNCGQSTNTHRLTVRHLIHELFHALTHTDKGIIHLLQALAIRPGSVAIEYIQGKRKKWFNPFTFLLLCLGFFVFMNNVFQTGSASQKADPKIIAALPTEKARQQYINLMDRSATASKIINNHSNVVALIAVPLYSLIIWLFFRHRGRNFAEILTATVLFTAFANLAFTLLITPSLSFVKGTPWFFYLSGIGLLLQAFYYAWGFEQFFSYNSISGFLKAFGACMLTFIIWLLFVMTMIFYYVYGENTGKVFSALLEKLTGA